MVPGVCLTMKTLPLILASWVIFFAAAVPLAFAQSVTIDLVPPKLPRGTSFGSYSPPIEIGYSGLGAGIFKLHVWLLQRIGGPNWPLASNQWNGDAANQVITIDNTSGSNSSGKISLIRTMDVYDVEPFDWVVRLRDQTSTAELAFAEHYTDATLNHPPVLAAIGGKSVPRGNYLTFTVTASDPDGSAIIFGASNLPPGASFDPASGVFLWQPTAAGDFTAIRFTATDAGDGPLTDAEEISISVIDKPWITSQPQPLLLSPGQSGALTVVADASPSSGTITYQWTKNDVEIPGAVSTSLQLENVSAADAATYRVIATNTKGSTVSHDAFVGVVVPRSNEETAARCLEFLRERQDEFHRTVDVYRDIDSAGNHFHARGFIPDEDAKVTTNGAWTTTPYAGATCMKFTFERDATGVNGGGIYLLNGVLINGAPVPYFGESQLTVGGQTYQFVDSNEVDLPSERSFHGPNLTGATKLVFYARGELGGEQIEFFTGGVGCAPYAQPHPDSSSRFPVGGTLTTLTNSWARYEIDLTGMDLSDIKGGFGWFAEAIHNPRPTTTFYVDDVYFELSPAAQMQRLAQPRFLRSFVTLNVQPSWAPGEPMPFDLAFRSTISAYDQATALFAFLAEETPDGLRRARIIADAFVYAVNHHRDPYVPGSTRLRGFSRFYKGGDIALPPGWEVNGRAGTVPAAGLYHEATQSYTEMAESNLIDVGDNLWCVMALLAVFEKTGDSSYLQTALVAAEEVHERKRTVGTYQGFIAGIEAINSPQPKERTYRSLEHHLDAVAAFRRLYHFTGDPKWLADANHALAFVEQMWSDARGCYLTGTSPEPNPQPNGSPGQLPEDAQSWAILALDPGEVHGASLDCVEVNHRVVISGFDAFDFADDRDGFWPEGLGHIIDAYYLRNGPDERQRARQLALLLSRLQQIPAPHGDGRGIVAASHDFLTSGFGFDWFRRMHTGATSWAYLALVRYNPFTARTMLSQPFAGQPALPSPNVFRFNFQGEAGEFYRVESSVDLLVWSPVEVLQLLQPAGTRDYPFATGTEKIFIRAVHKADND